MADAAMLTSSKPALTPGKGAGQGQKQPAGGEQPAGGGFTALLNEVEDIAASGGPVAFQVVPLPQPVSRKAISAGDISFTESLMPKTQPGEKASLLDALKGRSLPIRPIDGQTSPSLQQTARAELRQDMLQPHLSVRGPQVPQQELALAPVSIDDTDMAARIETAVPKFTSQVAATPRLEAAIQQQATPETSNPVVRQVASNLQYLARGEMERIRFDLYPEELGRVQIQLQKSGAVTRVTIVTETAQAFEALARGAGGLQQSLQQSGFDADDLTFEHREHRDGDQQAEAEERRERRGRGQPAAGEERGEVLVRPATTPQDRLLFL